MDHRVRAVILGLGGVLIAGAFGAVVGWSLCQVVSVKPKIEKVAELQERVNWAKVRNSACQEMLRKVRDEYNMMLAEIDQIERLLGDQQCGVGAAERSQGSRPSRGDAAAMTTKVKPWIFSLEKCAKEGRLVRCHLTVTNTGEGADLALFARSGGVTSFLLDDADGFADATRVHLGDVSGGASVKIHVASGVATQAVVIFEGVSDSADSAVALSIQFWSEHAGEIPVAFFEVPFVL